tara:strand:+ start:477 stop:1433 length:957 start_codon:yes stop_codon:yes gene_type:complete
MGTDTRFWLKSMLENEFENKIEYKHFQREIKNRGYFVVKTDNNTVKIYTPELAFILTSKQVPALEDLRKETFINGFDYLDTYVDGYRRGEQYFKKEFRVSPNTLYGVNAEQYVRDLHLNYFHVVHISSHQGWSYVKKNYPIILTHKAVKEFGYYSGIVNKVDEQIEKHPRLFATFDKCENDLPPQHINKQIPELNETELSEIIIKHFSFFNGKCPRKHKSILSDENFRKLIEWTIYFYKNQFEVPEIRDPIKIVNTNKTFVQLAFKYLFKELHKSSPYHKNLFTFYSRAFIKYSLDKRSNFIGVRNNDEVKKLMKIKH